MYTTATVNFLFAYIKKFPVEIVPPEIIIIMLFQTRMEHKNLTSSSKKDQEKHHKNGPYNSSCISRLPKPFESFVWGTKSNLSQYSLKNALAVTQIQIWHSFENVTFGYENQPASQTTIILRGDFTSD